MLNDAYGTGLLEYTKAPYEAAGGEVAYEVIYDPQAENFDAECRCCCSRQRCNSHHRLR